ncbi:DUF2567 domain-containing protein [Alloactinosynnema sp. L-07]|uniref:DUF2567 domain-containing protein n=1 Tax=Alloactinosynnema sp. L-07 TaxID=1653480 RepID=UPI0006B62CEB|nr:DUF2567 domain-containing protein [Alloactinosynnema sp. L-07]
MPEPTESEVETPVSEAAVRVETPPPPVFPLWHQPRPKVRIKADLLPAVSIASFIALFGMAIGWLWSRLAPAQLVVVAEGGKLIPLRAESYHRFDDLVLFVLLGLGAGVVTGAGVWMLRERRGPVIMIAAVVGSGLAAWLAMQVGVSWAEARFVVEAAPKIGDVLPVAPRLESRWVVVGWPLGAALAYGFAAAWNGRDDLGRRLG